MAFLKLSRVTLQRLQLPSSLLPTTLVLPQPQTPQHKGLASHFWQLSSRAHECLGSMPMSVLVLASPQGGFFMGRMTLGHRWHCWMLSCRMEQEGSLGLLPGSPWHSAVPEQPLGTGTCISFGKHPALQPLADTGSASSRPCCQFCMPGVHRHAQGTICGPGSSTWGALAGIHKSLTFC